MNGFKLATCHTRLNIIPHDPTDPCNFFLSPLCSFLYHLSLPPAGKKIPARNLRRLSGKSFSPFLFLRFSLICLLIIWIFLEVPAEKSTFPFLNSRRKIQTPLIFPAKNFISNSPAIKGFFLFLFAVFFSHFFVYNLDFY